jgi:hypothetical protein
MIKRNSNIEERKTIQRDQLLTIGDMDDFKHEIIEELRNLFKETQGHPNKKWLRSYEIRKMLGISPGTLQNMRVNGTLPYSKIGGIVYYRYDDVVKLLERNTR